jgi:hypothetical protein
MMQTQATSYTTLGLTIEIHPKDDKEDDDNKWKGVLLQMLKAYGKLKAESAVVWFII